MSFSVAEKIRFLVDLASFLCILIKATCAGLTESYFSAKISLNASQSFSTTRKTVVKKAVLKPLEGLFCFVVKFFNSL